MGKLSSKVFKFGEKKYFKQKQRMKLFNQNKSNAKKEAKIHPKDIEIDVAFGTDKERDGDRDENIDLNLQNDITMNEGGNENTHVANLELHLNENDGNDTMEVGGNNNDEENEEANGVEANFDDCGSGEVEDEERRNEEAIDVEPDLHDCSSEEDEENHIQGRRIVDLDNFLWQLKRISGHNDGNCSFDELKFTKEIRIGLHSKIVLTCNTCDKSFLLYTNDDEKTTATMCVNSSAVLGANMIGIGFTQLEQFTSILDVPVMCNDKFKGLNDKVGKTWEETAQEFMRQAAKEEAQAAIERGDIDDDGIPFITVVIDGCWSKRSYNRNFTALSGVSAIIGAHTGKVLWIDVRNKYCVICVRHANKSLEPPAHNCTRNHSGPSSEMEWQGVLQGFQSSVEFYNLRYVKVISDGDSSTYAKLLEHKPYGNRHIEKIECTNHLHRNFYKAIMKAVKGCPRGLNKHVCNNLERIRKDICCAVQYRRNQNTTESEKISFLKSDLNNILHHVFGDHSNCPDYIKKYCKDDDENYVPALIQCNTFEKMSAVVRQLMYCAKDLLLGETNNIAEHYNSIVAKFVGGKRVNFSLSNSYKYRANAAALQYNTKAPLSALYNYKFNTNPSALATKIEQKRLRKVDREKERRQLMKANKIFRTPFCRLQQSGSGYGPNSERPDLSDIDFNNEKRVFMEKLSHFHETRSSVEENTRLKHKSLLWNEIVKTVILTYDFGPICKARSLAARVREITTRKYGETKAIRHFNQSLPVAQLQLAKEQKIRIEDCGIYIGTEHAYLAASPSGISDSETIIHIECPLAIINMDPNDPKVLGKLDFIDIGEADQVVGLKTNHNIYYDIQGQLHICNKSVCIFALWTGNRYKMYIERIVRDPIYFDTKMKNKLTTFYNNWLLPELINPRLSRNMPVREPNI